VQHDKISLDVRRKVLIVDGTTNPRVVRLSPQTSGSCPAQSNCYHAEAPQLAIGLSNTQPSRRLNLTQLRKNKRKHTDKTSGRKRPRANDVDIVAADNVEPDVAESLMISASASDVCAVCTSDESPVRRGRKKSTINWVQCDKWFYCLCVGLRAIPDSFQCC